MGAEFEIAHGLVNLKLNLGEFVAVVKQIAGITKHRKTQDALKSAIGEIRKSCDTAVDVFTPLYALTSDTNFQQNFGALHANFKNSYLKNIDSVRTHCHIVKTYLNDLLQKKEWLAGVPLLEHSYNRLAELCDRWLFSDGALSYEMDSLLKSIDAFYTDIMKMAYVDESAAFVILRSGVAQFEDDFLSLRGQLNALDILGKTI
jgi:hypothetical protein